MTDWTTTRPRRRGESWGQQDGDQTAVYSPETGMLHLLNASARAIWELCDGETGPQEMAEAINDLTGLDYADAWTDISQTLDRLAELGLIGVPSD
ncbi:MAG: HPr-rel-A system PqqD family peptide chaperone [Acidimicrobiia bacterium]